MVNGKSNDDGKSKLIAICVFLAVATFLVFWPVVHHDFVNFDDPGYVTEPHIQAGLTWHGIVWAFTTWHPLTWISHMLDVQLFGTASAGPHFVNLVFHAANTVLLFVVLRNLAGAVWPSALVAALFALHPLHVETVAWVAERKGLLSTFFGLLCLWTYGRYAKGVSGAGCRVPGDKSEILPQSGTKSETNPKSETRSGAPEEPGSGSEVKGSALLSAVCHLRPSIFYLLSLLLFGLGLMSKPMLVTLPFVMLLLDYWPLRRFRPPERPQPVNPPLHHSGTPALRLFVEKLPFLALAVASSIVTLVLQRNVGALQPLANYSARSRFEGALAAYVQYLSKTFWPVGLATPYSRLGHWPVWGVVLAALLLISCCLAAFSVRRKLPFVTVGWFWFVGTLIPVIGIIQVGAHYMADRYTYLPLIGLFIILVWGAGEAVERLRPPRAAALLAVGLALLACAGRTRDQLRHWQNSVTLYRHALEVTQGNVIAYYNLGMHFADHGQPDEALENYRKALEIKPDHADSLNNIGNLLAANKKYQEAITYFQAALKAKPDLVEARNNIGYALRLEGKTDEAIEQYRLALKLKPDHVGVLNNLGNALAAKGQYAEAVSYFEASARADPAQVTAQYDLARALVRLGRLDEAITHFQLALERAPHSAEAHQELGLALAKQRKLEQAVVQFNEALRYRPDNPFTHYFLAKALAALGKSEEAAAHYREALRLKPDLAEAQRGLKALGEQTTP
jgi:tetratricopeptide (TPR) repeat protein